MSGEGIHVRRAYRHAHHAHPRRSEYASEPRAELRIVVAEDHLRYAIHGGVPSLLRAPLVGRCIRDGSMEVRPATQVQEEEYKHLAEPNVEGLDEVAGPRDMVSKEGSTNSARYLAVESGGCISESFACRRGCLA